MFPLKKLGFVIAWVLMLASSAIVIAAMTSPTVAEANNPPNTILGTVSVDPGQDPNDTTPTAVRAILEANGRYYIGGLFSEVGGESQPFLAAIEVATGQLDHNFRPVISGGSTEINTIALSPNGQDLYIGGLFTSVDGVSRNRIAKLDAITGELDAAFNPNASAEVETIQVDDEGVYVGGGFQTIGGLTSPHLAKLDPNTGAADTAWTASTSGRVFDIEVVGNNVYVGGNFTEVSGAEHSMVVRLERSDGSVNDSWNVDPAEEVPFRVQAMSLSQDRNTIYVGTGGPNDGGGNTVYAYSKFGDLEWSTQADGDIQALEASASQLYAGTHGQFVFDGNGGSTRREKLFALDLDNGDLLAWDPHANSINGVWEIERGPSGLLVGGDFSQILNPSATTGENNPFAAEIRDLPRNRSEQRPARAPVLMGLQQ